MNNLNVKSGDLVLVITGKDKGKQGKVLKTSPKTNRIVVEGVNMISRHQKARRAQEKSQIVKKEGAIDVSNVMIVCPTCGKPTRVKHAVQDGKVVRTCKCGSALDKKFVKETKKSTRKAAAKTEEVAPEATETVEKTAPKAKTTAQKTAEKKVVATQAAKTTKTSAARKSSQRGV